MTSEKYRATTTTLVIIMLAGGLLLGIGPSGNDNGGVVVDPSDIEAVPGDPNDQP